MPTSDMLTIMISVMIPLTGFLYKYSETHKKYRRLFIVSLSLTVFLSFVTVFLWGWTVSHKEINDENIDETIENEKSDGTNEVQQEQIPSEQNDEIEDKNIDWAIVAESRTVVVALYLEEPDGDLTLFNQVSGFFVDKDTVVTVSFITEPEDFLIQAYNETHNPKITKDDLKLKVVSPHDNFICNASRKVIDVENDIALLSIRDSEELFSSTDIFPKFRTTLPVTGEELSSLGYTYDQERGDAGFYPYKFVCLPGKVLNDINLNDSITKSFYLRTTLTDDESLAGTAGGPIIDEEGYVIGIGEASTVDQFDGEIDLFVISTNEIQKLLHQ